MRLMSDNSFGARSELEVGDRRMTIHRLDALEAEYQVSRLPFSLKILLENLLRHEDGVSVTREDIEALARWDGGHTDREIAFAPARILMQDFTGVPAVVDLAAMRDAMEVLGGNPSRVNPLVPAELVIDHSVIADEFGTAGAFARNAQLEFQRNEERYQFLRWGADSFDGFKVVPPDTGIVHQVNLEYLSRVVFTDDDGNAYPDTLVGTDSHTTMVNGLGVVGWGVGGIEAEAAMLGQPISMLIPKVVGFKISGELPEGVTATDMVLTVTELLRKHGVVGKFVEFYGPGVGNVALANRATIGNMSPEYGSTITIFPIDAETLRYLEFSGRSEEQVDLVEAYAKEQGLWHDPNREPMFTETLELDLSTIVPSLAGPARPQDRVPLDQSKALFAPALLKSLPDPEADTVDEASLESSPASDPPSTTEGEGDQAGRPDPTAGPDEPATKSRPRKVVPVALRDGSSFNIDHGHVVIAAITSCTNTSNPSVMLAAGLLARNAVDKGLTTKPWVKTTMAPGSKVVMDYYDSAGLTPYLEKLRFNLVGFGCTTCIGNSGPLLPEVSDAVNGNDLAVVSVLSGNRNFEGRINADVRMNYLMSPPLVVAYALAGTMDIDLYKEPLGEGADGPVYLRDIWPRSEEVDQLVFDVVQSSMFRKTYSEIFKGDDRWASLVIPTGDRFEWSDRSTYVRKPPYFDGMPAAPTPVVDIAGARLLAAPGAGSPPAHTPPGGPIRRAGRAGKWLIDGGVAPGDFTSYGARRGNHEVMIRGTFANTRLRNRLAPGTEGGVTLKLPEGDQMPMYDASMRYKAEGTPLVILAGKEYGSGSSRDWAAKGTYLLGVRAVIAESFERIHRSNLIGMGVLPLQFADGETVATLGLTGHEVFSVEGVDAMNTGPVPQQLTVRADDKQFTVRLRIDTPKEADYYRHGGILQYVARQLAKA